MAVIVQKVPFGPVQPGQYYLVPNGDPILQVLDQIILWMSVTNLEVDQWPTHAHPFPVVLDTGFNNSFLMPTLQLISRTKAGFYENLPRSSLSLTSGGETIPMYEAAIWLHPNKPGTRDLLPGGKPFRLDLPAGIALAPVGSRLLKPLPLLGLMPIRFNDLRVEINGSNETVSILAP